MFSRTPDKAIRRLRDAVKEILKLTFTDEVATFTALSGLIRGWGNYYAYAAESRLMDSLDAFIYQQLWGYCLRKNQGLGAQAVYHKYTLPRPLRIAGHYQIGIVVGTQIIRIPRLSGIPRQALRLPYPPHPYLMTGRNQTLPSLGTTDEKWWDRRIWAGQEGNRIGQCRLAVEVLGRDVICRICGIQPALITHHDPAWKECVKHDPQRSMGVCRACHRQLHGVDG